MRPANVETSGLQRLLRVLVCVMLMGAARTLQLNGSSVSSVLWHDFMWSEAAFTGVDAAASYILYATALLALVLPRGRLLAYAMLPSVVWLILVPLAKVRAGGDFGYMLAPFAQGNRPLALMALAVVALGPRAHTVWAVRLLKWGVVAVFASHGIEALFQNPRFIDYLIVSSHRLLSLPVQESTARILVYGIGAVDVLTAGLVLKGPNRAALGWAAVWGLLTAAMRLVYFGPIYGLPYAAIRVLNGGGALALLVALRAGLPYSQLHWRSREPATPGVIRAAI